MSAAGIFALNQTTPQLTERVFEVSRIMRHPPTPPRRMHASGVAAPRASPQHACAVCAATRPLQACKGCQTALYCSRACQKKDWPRHKPLCGRPVDRPHVCQFRSDTPSPVGLQEAASGAGLYVAAELCRPFNFIRSDPLLPIGSRFGSPF